MRFGLTDEVLHKINEVFRRYPQVEQVILYGSRAMGRHRYNSDIDLTLLGSNLDLKTLFKIETELDDLLLPYKIDLSIFDHIDNPDLLDHIRRVGKVFYQREDAGAERETLLIEIMKKDEDSGLYDS
ncbi:MAG: nucleotidyltransferase domain-containing protein [Phaeodactylibacter sp.]|nr:nucleotidyltransferase domain-containing protein [Phaeodactylibacter sp.]